MTDPIFPPEADKPNLPPLIYIVQGDGPATKPWIKKADADIEAKRLRAQHPETTFRVMRIPSADLANIRKPRPDDLALLAGVIAPDVCHLRLRADTDGPRYIRITSGYEAVGFLWAHNPANYELLIGEELERVTDKMAFRGMDFTAPNAQPPWGTDALTRRVANRLPTFRTMLWGVAL